MQKKKYNAEYYRQYYLDHKDKKIAYSRDYRKININKRRKYYIETFDKFTDMRLKKKFGISLDEYNQLYKKQNGLCAICGNPENGKKLSIDHCHKTDKIRGLLCQCCNWGLGSFKDNPKLLNKAIEYLQQ